MLLYNITVGIDKDIEEEWLVWIKDVYLSAIMQTKLFTEYKMYKVLTHDDATSVSYSIQLFSLTIENVVHYLDRYAPLIVESQRSKFSNKHVVFNTLLEEI